MSKGTILVTGGCGFIGSNFVFKLLNDSYDIVIIDNLSTGFNSNLIQINKYVKSKNINIWFYKIDLCKKKKLKQIFLKHTFDYIFHFAAYSSVDLSLKNSKSFMANNIKSTDNLIHFAKKFEIKKFIFSSSAAVYGNIKQKKNLKENSICKPINPYGKSKLVCEKNLKNRLDKNTEFCIFRYFNVVGHHINKKIIKKKNRNIFEKILNYRDKNKTFSIFGNSFKTKDGTAVRDYVHVKDIIKAHTLCLKQKKKFWNNIYNIGYNKGISVMQIIYTFNKISKKKIKFNYKKKTKGIIAYSVADNKKLINSTMWKPSYFSISKLIKEYFNLK